MASYELNAESGYYRVAFRFADRKYHRSLKTRDEKEANERCGVVENRSSSR
jgi:hypothetical protein